MLRRHLLAAPIALLKGWDDRWGADSEATSLAVFWGDGLWRDVGEFARAERVNVPDYIATRATPIYGDHDVNSRPIDLHAAGDQKVEMLGCWGEFLKVRVGKGTGWTKEACTNMDTTCS